MLEMEKRDMVGGTIVKLCCKINAKRFPTLLLWAIVSIMLFPAGSPPARAEAKMMVMAAAAKYEVPPDLALGISHVESRHRCGLTGRAGEKGPMQILPSTAKGLGYRNIRNASCETQIDAAMVYLKRCLDRAGGNKKRAAACYNAGPRALSWRTLPARVSAYVSKVLQN